MVFNFAFLKHREYQQVCWCQSTTNTRERDSVGVFVLQSRRRRHFELCTRNPANTGMTHCFALLQARARASPKVSLNENQEVYKKKLLHFKPWAPKGNTNKVFPNKYGGLTNLLAEQTQLFADESFRLTFELNKHNGLTL